VGKTAKSSSIFVAKVDTFSSLSQVLEKIAIGEYEIKIINNKQVKIQSSSIAYIVKELKIVNIVKELKSNNMEFYTYKSKQEIIFRIVLKHIHVYKLDDVRKEIEDLEYIVTNIWKIKKQGTEKAFPMFYVELNQRITIRIFIRLNHSSNVE